MRSLSRRATRAVRPFIRSNAQQELWVVGFDESCRLVGFQRLIPGLQGWPLASPALILGWAEGAGARAIVLVQNQPGPRDTATPVDILPTLKLAAAANLFGFILVDHVLIHSFGALTLLRERIVLAEAQAYIAQLRTDLGDLAASHSRFGLPRPPESTVTLP